MKVDEDHSQMGPPHLMEGQHRVVDKLSVMKGHLCSKHESQENDP